MQRFNNHKWTRIDTKESELGNHAPLLWQGVVLAVDQLTKTGYLV